MMPTSTGFGDEQAPQMAPRAAEDARLQEERDLAARLFPDMWRNALGMTGKRGNTRRRNIRRWAVEAALLEPLKAAGASCATCDHRLRNPGGLKGLFCDLDSDFHGYMGTAPDALCSRYDGPRTITRATGGGERP